MENATMHCLSTQGLVSKVVPPVFIVEFVIGLPANVLALWIFCCRMRTWGSTAVFLLNLLIADFFLLASVPFRIDYFLRVEDWVFGDAWCRINLFALAVNRSASIAFMTIVAIDRYFKVVHPHHMVNQLTKAQAGMLSGLTWTVLLSLRLPLLANQLLHPDKLLNTTLCRSFSSYGTLTAGLKLHYGLYFFEFFIPFLLLIFCSLRIVCFLRHRQLDRKQKVKRAMHVVLLIVAVFTICFLPGIASGLTALSIQKLRPKDCISFTIAAQIFSMSLGFTYLNSTLDPIIYCFSSSMFRNTLKSSLNLMGIFHMQVSRRGSLSSDL